MKDLHSVLTLTPEEISTTTTTTSSGTTTSTIITTASLSTSRMTPSPSNSNADVDHHRPGAAAAITAAAAPDCEAQEAVTQVAAHRVAHVAADMPENLSPLVASDYEPLLPDADPSVASRICLVLDLDETLVHSCFRPTPFADVILPVELKNSVHHAYVLKRPGVEEFLRRMSDLFEVVIFTASLQEYADPLLDELETCGVKFHHRLFREHCVNANGIYVKDLSLLGRPLNRTVIVDNSPGAFLFQPRNSIQATSWFEDPEDTELTAMIPLMESLAQCANIYKFLDRFRSIGQSLSRPSKQFRRAEPQDPDPFMKPSQAQPAGGKISSTGARLPMQPAASAVEPLGFDRCADALPVVN
eukprot:NODE_1332_length_1581_cov_57.500653_g1196_i0.p1 GENE.NODE_1332_length_1581_cov_57.500653_g1196_i0~~NODE_1332_length_1581_cov_57.500653_g1196_i0.p1  ORF type:complete len:358 (+),score=47.82 NODE_1332_length_1581_cov_57.500653_g1196_i0:253-1326(+)